MLNQIKLLLGLTDNSKDELLTVLIERCIEEFNTYTRNNDSTGCESLIASMVVFQYNRLGSEGVDSENYSGVSFDYSSDYPETIIKQLKAKRKLQV